MCSLAREGWNSHGSLQGLAVAPGPRDLRVPGRENPLVHRSEELAHGLAAGAFRAP